VEIVGHRGAAGEEPENTIRAVLRGIECGATYIEVDLRRTADGALVIMHDETVDRTTNGRGRVAEMTLSEIRRLDAGKGERVPILDEVLDAVEGRAVLLLELKEAGYEGDVWSRVESRGMVSEVVFISFLPEALRAVKDISGGRARIGLIFSRGVEEALNRAAELEVEVIAPHYRLVNRSLVDEARRLGVKVDPWTVNGEEVLEKMFRLGVDLVTTDYPCKMRRLLEKIKGLSEWL